MAAPGAIDPVVPALCPGVDRRGCGKPQVAGGYCSYCRYVTKSAAYAVIGLKPYASTREVYFTAKRFDLGTSPSHSCDST